MRRVDARADVWALGVIAFELFAGQRPFAARTPPRCCTRSSTTTPPDLRKLRRTLPDALRAVVTKALEKNPAERLPRRRNSGGAAGVASARPRRRSGRPEGLRALRRPMIAIPLAAILLAAGGLAIFATVRQRRTQWARDVAFPKPCGWWTRKRSSKRSISRRARSTSRQTTRSWRSSSRRFRERRRSAANRPARPCPTRTTPIPSPTWRVLGVTPLDGVKVPATYLRWRFEKAGFDAVEVPRLHDRLHRPAGEHDGGRHAHAGRRHAAGHGVRARLAEPFRLYIPGFEHLGAFGTMAAFWIDRFEVTNADYKKFVDAGGYRRREFWQEPFLDKGKPVDWDHAVARFVDSTGRPGPAAWMQSEPPAGEDQLPVTGVSWYEAAAYARFAGKSLPSLHHWARAAEPRAARWVVPFSNFGGRGPGAAGARQALHASGAYDMAGNVKEWTSTDTNDGRRYILGGGWDEPIYTFNDPDARAPFDRGRTFGFRCVTYPTAPTRHAPGAAAVADARLRRERPAPDQVFEIYRRLYAYDRQPFTAKTLAVADDREDWRRETIVMPAPYGGETMKLFLFVPKRATPPFETVVFFPGSNAFRTRSIDQFPLGNIDFLVKSGRAVAFPELKGTFDRQGLQDSTANPSVLYRDHVIAWIKDVSRAIDYLATRQDLSMDRLALFGISWGGRLGAIIPAVESRIKVQVLVVGGFSMQRPLPEVDQFNFASRVTIPTLMLNGRYDFFFPVDSSQIPMFEAFRTPKDQKRHLLYDGGHNIPRVELIKETLSWLDRFQRPDGSAPVKR